MPDEIDPNLTPESTNPVSGFPSPGNPETRSRRDDVDLAVRTLREYMATLPEGERLYEDDFRLIRELLDAQGRVVARKISTATLGEYLDAAIHWALDLREADRLAKLAARNTADAADLLADLTAMLRPSAPKRVKKADEDEGEEAAVEYEPIRLKGISGWLIRAVYDRGTWGLGSGSASRERDEIVSALVEVLPLDRPISATEIAALPDAIELVSLVQPDRDPGRLAAVLHRYAGKTLAGRKLTYIGLYLDREGKQRSPDRRPRWWVEAVAT